MEGVPNLLELASLSLCRDVSKDAATVADVLMEPSAGIDRLERAVSQAARVRDDADDLVTYLVARARAAGLSWQSIGAALGVTRQAAEARYKARVGDLTDAALFPIRRNAANRPVSLYLPGADDVDEELLRLDAWAHARRPERGAHQATEAVGGDSYSTVSWQESELHDVLSDARAAMLSGGDSSPLPRGVSIDYAHRRHLQLKIAQFEAIAREDPELAEDALASAARVRKKLVVALADELRPQIEADWSGGPAAHLMLWGQRIAALERVGEGPDGMEDTLPDGWWLRSRPADGPGTAHAVEVAADAARQLASSAAIAFVAAAVAEGLARGQHPFRRGGFAPKRELTDTLA